MWTRELLKNNAKEMLKKQYWKVFLVCLIYTMVGGIISSGTSIISGPSFSLNFSTTDAMYGGGSISSEESVVLLLGILIVFFVIFAVVLAATVAVSIFLVYPFLVGVNKYLLNAYKGKNEYGDMIYAFKDKRYAPVVKSMALVYLYEFLWSLLFIIPGIVKSYSYAMVPYILSDNPNIGAKRAIELSEKMTKGEKWNMFVLDLSFYGWFFLGTIVCCGLGTIFVTPYYMSTHAYLYMILRDKAVINGYCTVEELGFSAPQANQDNQAAAQNIQAAQTFETVVEIPVEIPREMQQASPVEAPQIIEESQEIQEAQSQENKENEE